MNIRGVIVTVLLACCVVLIGMGYYFDLHSSSDIESHDADRVPYVEIAMKDDEASLVGPVIEEWTNWEVSAQELNNYYRPFGETYTNKNVEVNWGVYDIPNGSFIKKQHFEISTDPSFQNAERYDLRAGERNIVLGNLQVDTQYFFRVSVDMESSEGCSVEHSFRTAWSPRIIECDGLDNVRDVGGWKTVDGKTVKQGMLYRGCELDGVNEKKYLITKAGAHTMQKELKIKTELDLRYADGGSTKDMLGQSVKHIFFAFPSYENFFSDDSKDYVKGVFETLAEKDNYPIYLHCTDGADRTGVACYVLDALLGMSAEDCYREWELSVFAGRDDTNFEAMDRFVAAFRQLEGETLQDQAENYLLSVGITQEQIDSIQTFLIQ